MGYRYLLFVTSGALALLLTMFASSVEAQSSHDDISRTASGRPDLSGTYDIATLTPLQRPRKFGDRSALTPEEAAIALSSASGVVEVFWPGAGRL